MGKLIIWGTWKESNCELKYFRTQSKALMYMWDEYARETENYRVEDWIELFKHNRIEGYGEIWEVEVN